MPKLAVDGGPPVRTAPFAPWPYYAEDEIAAVEAVLRSGKVNYWTGDTVDGFEKAYAQALGVRHAIAVANGSVALELALHALGIGPGDEVIVTSRSFVASASCIALAGATPVFADVDADSQNVTAQTIEAAIGPRTRALILVHLAGWPCDFDTILPLARQHGLKVVEDCAQAHGARCKGRPLGSFGDAVAFSFCQDKIISTGGEGDLLVTDDENVWKRAWAYKDHGKNVDRISAEPPGVEFRWLHDTMGTNWRMTAMQAVIGACQLNKLAEWIAQRAANANQLAEGLAGHTALRVPNPAQCVVHSYYRFYVFLHAEMLAAGWSRPRILEALRGEGIPCASGSCSEIYRERAFATLGLQPAEPLPTAKLLGETGIALLVHPTLGEEDMQDTVDAFGKVLTRAAYDR